MNAVEIYEKASWDLEHNKITLGAFEERIRALYDVEPVRHSVWRVASADPDKEYECMNCKKAVGWKYLYCPNCGARMDRKEQEDGDTKKL